VKLTYLIKRWIKGVSLLAIGKTFRQTPFQTHLCFLEGRPEIEIVERTESETKFIVRMKIRIPLKCRTDDYPDAEKEVEGMKDNEPMVIIALWYMNQLDVRELFDLLQGFYGRWDRKG